MFCFFSILERLLNMLLHASFIWINRFSTLSRKTFKFTFMHLVDTFFPHCIYLISSCFAWESNPWPTVWASDILKSSDVSSKGYILPCEALETKTKPVQFCCILWYRGHSHIQDHTLCLPSGKTDLQQLAKENWIALVVL